MDFHAIEDFHDGISASVRLTVIQPKPVPSLKWMNSVALFVKKVQILDPGSDGIRIGKFVNFVWCIRSIKAARCLFRKLRVCLHHWLWQTQSQNLWTLHTCRFTLHGKAFYFQIESLLGKVDPETAMLQQSKRHIANFFETTHWLNKERLSF